MKKRLQILLKIILVITTLIYPCFMVMMSATGWMYQFQSGNYPAVFRLFSIGMYFGGGLLCIGTVLLFFGKKPRFWKCNIMALLTACIGCMTCLVILSQFSAYADQNFSGIGETMKPVSEMYRDRISPVIVPALLLVVLSVWQLLETREERLEEYWQKENAEAPKILHD